MSGRSDIEDGLLVRVTVDQMEGGNPEAAIATDSVQSDADADCIRAEESDSDWSSEFRSRTTGCCDRG
jgi:hypothetical protein